MSRMNRKTVSEEQIARTSEKAAGGRLPYQSPRLQYFGAVTDLTNNFGGTCKDDGVSMQCGTGNMGDDQMV
jgi:hypothetical protein